MAQAMRRCFRFIDDLGAIGNPFLPRLTWMTCNGSATSVYHIPRPTRCVPINLWSCETFGLVALLIVLCPYIRIQLADDDKTVSVMGMCRLKITHHIKLGTSLCAPRVGHNCVYVILGESWLKSHGSISIDIYGFDGYTYRCINFWS